MTTDVRRRPATAAMGCLGALVVAAVVGLWSGLCPQGAGQAQAPRLIGLSSAARSAASVTRSAAASLASPVSAASSLRWASGAARWATGTVRDDAGGTGTRPKTPRPVALPQLRDIARVIAAVGGAVPAVVGQPFILPVLTAGMLALIGARVPRPGGGGRRHGTRAPPARA